MSENVLFKAVLFCISMKRGGQLMERGLILKVVLLE